MNILAFLQPGTNSREIFNDIIEGYQIAGNNIHIIDLSPLWAIKKESERAICQNFFTELVCHSIINNKIDLCICLWGTAILALNRENEENFFNDLKVPLIMHWLDSPQWAHGGNIAKLEKRYFNGAYCYHYINATETADEANRIFGFTNILSCPNAASPRSFFLHPRQKKEFDIIFALGKDNTKPSNTMLDELEKDAPNFDIIRKKEGERIKNELINTINDIFSKKSEEFVDKIIDFQLKNRHTPLLHKIESTKNIIDNIDDNIKIFLDTPTCYLEFSSLLREIEKWERKFSFTWLTRYFKTATFGGCDFSDWPAKEYADYGFINYHQQSDVYSRGHFGLNIMRWQDDCGMNLKPFEITLSGVCLLQAERPCIRHFFNKSEIVTYNTLTECKTKTEQLLKNQDKMKKMAVDGRKTSLKKNCWEHRAAEVIKSCHAILST